ncbi:MAG: glycosyltransferase family 2 protein [Chitinophagaceae bacterium]|nr:glycosyltransferase family 2 protein [Chitinophagaceae bacterium]
MVVDSLSIVIPCLNESATIKSCITRAKILLAGLPNSGEILVVDNGSTDNTTKIAEAAGATVVTTPLKGYGAALHAGITAANGNFILFGDGDDSYHFDEAMPFIDQLCKGSDFVLGNRYKGGIEEGAMPFLHRYLGTPVISFLGRKSFRLQLGDFNCGMRAIKKTSYEKLQMQSVGMEYATEMIAKASYQKLSIGEVAVKLYKDGRLTRPHLHTWSDGWRHFRLILLLSPKWLLLFPSVLFLLLGLTFGSILAYSYVRAADMVLGIHTLYYSSVFLVISFQLFQWYILAKMHGIQTGLFPEKKMPAFFIRYFSFEKGLILGLILILLGFILSLSVFFLWKGKDFGPLDPLQTFRIVIPAGFLIMVGIQLIVFGFIFYTIRNLYSKKSTVLG